MSNTIAVAIDDVAENTEMSEKDIPHVWRKVLISSSGNDVLTFFITHRFLINTIRNQSIDHTRQ